MYNYRATIATRQNPDNVEIVGAGDSGIEPSTRTRTLK